MWKPWRDKTGRAKWISIFATLFSVSLGLCGLNFVGVMRFAPPIGPGSAPGMPPDPLWLRTLQVLLGLGAPLELVGMAVGLMGLISCLFMDDGE
jgi:hypothetical protein